jgi:DNA-binding NarL/FixJ family response regulator
MSGPRRSLRLCIVEEQDLYREAFRAFFATHPRFTLCEVSADTTPHTLVAMGQKWGPDVLLVGVKRLTPEGAHALREVWARCRETAVALAAAVLDPSVGDALRSLVPGGLRGFALLYKAGLDSPEDVARALLAISEGRILMDAPAFADFLGHKAPSAFLEDLSPREQEVLAFMAKGYSNEGIARALFLDPKTVERHINSIYVKIGEIPPEAHRRVYAVVHYLRAKGLLPTPSEAPEGGAPRVTARLAYPTTPSLSPPVSPDVAYASRRGGG